MNECVTLRVESFGLPMNIRRALFALSNLCMCLISPPLCAKETRVLPQLFEPLDLPRVCYMSGK